MSGFILLLFATAFAGEPGHFSLTAGGDVMLGRYKQETYHEVGGPNPFKGIAQYLDDADLTFVNLECPLMDGHPETMPKAPWTRVPWKSRTRKHKWSMPVSMR